MIVPGGKPTIYFTFTALVEEGDEVIYPNPGFPIYESLINFTGAKASAVADAGREETSAWIRMSWLT